MVLYTDSLISMLFVQTGGFSFLFRVVSFDDFAMVRYLTFLSVSFVTSNGYGKCKNQSNKHFSVFKLKLFDKFNGFSNAIYSLIQRKVLYKVTVTTDRTLAKGAKSSKEKENHLGP